MEKSRWQPKNFNIALVCESYDFDNKLHFLYSLQSMESTNYGLMLNTIEDTKLYHSRPTCFTIFTIPITNTIFEKTIIQ